LGWGVWVSCSNLTSVTFQASNISFGDWRSPFDGDLREKFQAGGTGTYTRQRGGRDSEWTKQ
jgi:hypothetical protein